MRYQLELALQAPWAGRVLLVCAVAACALFLPVSRLFGWKPVWTLLALLALAPIFTFTMPAGGLGPELDASGRAYAYVDSFLHPHAFGAELEAAGSDDERLANFLLFVPAGLLGTLASRRGVWTAAAGVALSFGIEGWQAASGVRVPSVADWLHNSAGVALGALTGMVILVAVRLVSSSPSNPSNPSNPSSPSSPSSPPSPSSSSWSAGRAGRAFVGSGFAVLTLALVAASLGVGTSANATTVTDVGRAGIAPEFAPYTGAQPAGFHIDEAPAGWEVRGMAGYGFTLAPPHTTDRNIFSCVGKVCVDLRKTAPRVGTTATSVGGRPAALTGWRSDGDGVPATLFVRQDSGRHLAVQAWDGLGWTESEIRRFAAGITLAA